MSAWQQLRHWLGYHSGGKRHVTEVAQVSGDSWGTWHCLICGRHGEWHNEWIEVR